MSAPRTCYGCGGSGRRGVFECGVCHGRGKLDGPSAQAHHADSFRRGVLAAGPERRPSTKRAPVIKVRRRRRIVRPDPEGGS